MVGGVPFYQGPLAALLKNPLYIGKVAQGGVLHEGEHEGIIDEAKWAEVQSNIASNRQRRKVGSPFVIPVCSRAFSPTPMAPR